MTSDVEGSRRALRLSNSFTMECIRAAPVVASEDVLEGHRTQLSTDSAEARSDPPRSPPIGSELILAHARRSRVRGPAQLRSGPRAAASMYDRYTSAFSDAGS